MDWKSLAASYEKDILPLVRHGKSDIFSWIKKYPVCHSGRNHMFLILEDILKLFPGKRILEQGAAEGVICRLLQDSGCDVFAVDIEPVFKKMWDQLKINGAIGDGYTLDWWDGSSFDVVIACVWVTSMGDTTGRGKGVDGAKLQRLRDIKKVWCEVLPSGGLVYVDINDRKVPIRNVNECFSDDFDITQFMLTPRLILKMKKK